MSAALQISLLATLVTSWSQYVLSAEGSVCVDKNLLRNVSDFAGEQLKHLHRDVLPSVYNFTDYTDEEGKWEIKDKTVWTSGIMAGMFWKQFEFTEDESWKAIADEHTMGLDGVELLDDNDLGFQVYNAFGMGYRLTAEKKYLTFVERGAESLFNFRYEANISDHGAFWSWNTTSLRKDWDLAVNVDMIMNMEIILFVGDRDDNEVYLTAASNHADTTSIDLIRDDYSTYHVAEYDNVTKELEEQATYQGESAESTWSRGQAWAIYGYVMTYRFTGKSEYLEISKNLLTYYKANLPDDNVPFADLGTHHEDTVCKDSSSAVITASASLELFSITGDIGYLTTSITFLEAVLSGDYYVPEDGVEYESILRRGCSDYNATETGTVFGDYFLLETMNRFKRMGLVVLVNEAQTDEYQSDSQVTSSHCRAKTPAPSQADSQTTAPTSSDADDTQNSRLGPSGDATVYYVCEADFTWLSEDREAVAWFGVHLDNVENFPEQITIDTVSLTVEPNESWVQGDNHVSFSVDDVAGLKTLEDLSEISVQFAGANSSVKYLVIGHHLTFEDGSITS